MVKGGQKEKVSFSKLFSISFKEYKDNFRDFSIFILLFIGLPLAILTFIDITAFLLDSNVRALVLNPTFENAFIPGYYLVIGFISLFLYVFFYFFTMAGLIGSSVNKKGYSYKELTKVGKEFWAKYLLFVIVVVFFVCLLLLLFIIPGIIFAIFWSFSAYIFFHQKKGILESLKKSKKLVKNDWWRVFGYMILICLILILIETIIGMPVSFIEYGLKFGFFPLSSGIFLFQSIYSLIITIVLALTYPFTVLFFKNFYFALRKEKGIK